jgi:hypothetical protein
MWPMQRHGRHGKFFSLATSDVGGGMQGRKIRKIAERDVSIFFVGILLA